MIKKKNFEYLKKRKFYERLDIYSFIIIQILLLIVIFSNKLANSLLNVIFMIICVIVGILYVSNFYSNTITIKICYFYVNSIDKATHVKMNIFSGDIIKRSIIGKILRENNIIKTIIEKKIYIYDKNKKQFYRAKYKKLKEKKVGIFMQSKGLTKDKINKKRNKFGENEMKIPIPYFLNLYKDHILTPFFIFQLISTFLKIFDNDSFYSLISIIMACIFEIIIVTQRIINLAFLRNMRTPPYFILAYRDNKWQEIPSNELLPGDIVNVIDGASVRVIKKEEDKETKNNIIIQIMNKLKEMKIREEEKKNQKSINTVLNKYKEKEKIPVACDMLILSGSVNVNESMLNGESAPQIKDSIMKMEYLQKSYLDMKNKHKNSIIFAGTKVLKAERNEENEPLPENVKIPPPINGAICLVIKTGFDTFQGKLLRKVLYDNKSNQQDNKKNDIIIIGILLIFAFFASCYVLKEGIQREVLISNSKLLIRCLIIMTSIIPTDLPIELSLIIYNSLFFFESKKIVCIQSFRIPLAGEVDICCFDKTGTLTKDEFLMKGIIKDSKENNPKLDDLDEETFTILLGCHSLLDIEGNPTGDSIDMAIFKEVGGKFVEKEIYSKSSTKIIQKKKYPFDSNLKRMTVLSEVYNENNEKKINRVLCKGAPEIIKTLLKEFPNDYDECYQKWSKKGYRVLALAYKDNEMFHYNTKREELEKDLNYSGFVILETPLKEKVNKYFNELINAKYDICIITGENLLTTIKISKELNLGKDKFALLKIKDKKLEWNNLDNKLIKETKSKEEVEILSEEYTLCITGEEYKNTKQIENFKKIYEIIQYITLFCRVNQIQKVEIIEDLKNSGKFPSMCGDGSNDVGALNLSTIGVAMLNIKENKLQKDEPFNLLSFDNEITMENLDAAAFAPFTSKGDSIQCVKKILVQGRCALAKFIQMYKIFIINSLMTIYIESFLYLKGIKLSDYQSVYLGFIVSMFFLMISKAKPLSKVNSNKPQKNIFNLTSFFSISGQFIIHLISMNLIIYVTEKVDPFYIRQEKFLDEKFSPNLINTVLFLFQIFNQSIIFIVNYQGEPFMKNLFNNSLMIWLISIIFFFGFLIFFDLYPQLNEDLELVQLPEDIIYKFYLILIMTINFVACYFIEKWKTIFGYFEPIPKSKLKKEKNA